VKATYEVCEVKDEDDSEATHERRSEHLVSGSMNQSSPRLATIPAEGSNRRSSSSASR